MIAQTQIFLAILEFLRVSFHLVPFLDEILFQRHALAQINTSTRKMRESWALKALSCLKVSDDHEYS